MFMLALVIFAVFLYLKMAGIGVVAGWSWLWVTSPLWAYASLVLLGLILSIVALTDGD